MALPAGGYPAKSLICDGAENITVDPRTRVAAYVCSRCDKTHLLILCDTLDAYINVGLNPHEAEALGHDLINPGPDPFDTQAKGPTQ